MEKAILQNTFREPTKSDYENVEPGMNLLGLVDIKNIMMKGFNEGDPEKPGYRLIFRSKENPKAFVTQKFSASSGPKSNCYKILKMMTSGGVSKEATPNELFTAMTGCLGHWYDVMCEHSPYQGGVWVNVTNNIIMPNKNADKENGDARTFFGDDTKRDPVYIKSEEEKIAQERADDNILF
jgi:hypothetical protein